MDNLQALTVALSATSGKLEGTLVNFRDSSSSMFSLIWPYGYFPGIGGANQD